MLYDYQNKLAQIKKYAVKYLHIIKIISPINECRRNPNHKHESWMATIRHDH